MIEFFAGSAALTEMVRMAGFRSARLDILYGTPKLGGAMNILTPSGMAPLV